ncbi:MAG: hypothetical protein QMB78_05305, partial [Rhodospirillales bacterium]
IFTIQDRPKRPVGEIIILIRDDVDRFNQNLVAKGVKFEREPAYSECFNVYLCLFLVPSGYCIEIQEFCNKKWEIGSKSYFNIKLTNSINLEFTIIAYSNFSSTCL